MHIRNFELMSICKKNERLYDIFILDVCAACLENNISKIETLRFVAATLTLITRSVYRQHIFFRYKKKNLESHEKNEKKNWSKKINLFHKVSIFFSTEDNCFGLLVLISTVR